MKKIIIIAILLIIAGLVLASLHAPKEEIKPKYPETFEEAEIYIDSLFSE